MMIAHRKDGGYRHPSNGDLPNIKTRDEDETRMERKRDVVIEKIETTANYPICLGFGGT